LVPPCPECVATRLNFGGLRMRVWDGKRYGTEITPLSRTRNRKPILVSDTGHYEVLAKDKIPSSPSP
jgi:hypothetical protein